MKEELKLRWELYSQILIVSQKMDNYYKNKIKDMNEYIFFEQIPI